MQPVVYDVDYFIRKFEAIPGKRWCCAVNKRLDGAMCALGHCGQFWDGSGGTKESAALDRLFHTNLGLSTWQINDGSGGAIKRFHQPTPKARILAALWDIKKAQYPELTEPPVYLEDILSAKGKEEIVNA